MFFIKTIPLTVYLWLLKNKHGQSAIMHVRLTFCLILFFFIHCVQLGMIASWLVLKFSGDINTLSLLERGSDIPFFFILGFFLASFAIPMIYTRKRLGRWRMENQNEKLIQYPGMIVWGYLLINLVIFFLIGFLLSAEAKYIYTHGIRH